MTTILILLIFVAYHTTLAIGDALDLFRAYFTPRGRTTADQKSTHSRSVAHR